MRQPTVALPLTPSPPRPTTIILVDCTRCAVASTFQFNSPAGPDGHRMAFLGSARKMKAVSRVMPLTREPSNTIEPLLIHDIVAQSPLCLGAEI